MGAKEIIVRDDSLNAHSEQSQSPPFIEASLTEMERSTADLSAVYTKSRTMSVLTEMSDGGVEKLNADIHTLSGEDVEVLDESSLFDEQVESDGCERVLRELTAMEKDNMADEHMPRRHYRAENGDVETAIKKIKATIAWRQQFEVEKIKTCFNQDGDKEMQKIIALENATGKIYVRGYDREGRAVLYLRPGMENTRHELNNMRHLTYQLERAIACTRQKCGKEKINIVIDYKGFKLRNAPPMSTTKHTLDILQNHYPERLHRAFICNPPLVFRTFWAVMSPFIDPVTKEKIVFCHGKVALEKLNENFDLETTERCAGGTKQLREFDSREYLSLPFSKTFDEKMV